MTRVEHLQWSKDRALTYVRMGQTSEAFTSLASDLQKHPDTKGHPGVDIGFGLMMIGKLSTPAEMACFIQGFN